jgi:uncharacterized phiE125 gp8 family phage protein
MAQYSFVNYVASTEPISLEEAKLYLRVDNDDEDSIITSMITSVREKVESLLWRPLISQTWKLYFDNLNDSEDAAILAQQNAIISINKCPIQAIDSIQYVDSNGETQTWSSGNYQVDLISEPCRVRLIAMPPMKADTMNALWFNFTAGYSDNDNIPKKILQAMYMLLGHYYEHRETVIVGVNSSELPMAVDYLLEEFKNNQYIYNNGIQ